MWAVSEWKEKYKRKETVAAAQSPYWLGKGTLPAIPLPTPAPGVIRRGFCYGWCLPFALVGKKNMYVGDCGQILPFHVVTPEKRDLLSQRRGNNLLTGSMSILSGNVFPSLPRLPLIIPPSSVGSQLLCSSESHRFLGGKWGTPGLKINK